MREVADGSSATRFVPWEEQQTWTDMFVIARKPLWEFQISIVAHIYHILVNRTYKKKPLVGVNPWCNKHVYIVSWSISLYWHSAFTANIPELCSPECSVARSVTGNPFYVSLSLYSACGRQVCTHVYMSQLLRWLFLVFLVYIWTQLQMSAAVNMSV